MMSVPATSEPSEPGRAGMPRAAVVRSFRELGHALPLRYPRRLLENAIGERGVFLQAAVEVLLERLAVEPRADAVVEVLHLALGLFLDQPLDLGEDENGDGDRAGREPRELEQPGER